MIGIGIGIEIEIEQKFTDDRLAALYDAFYLPWVMPARAVLDAAALSAFLSSAGLMIEEQFGDWAGHPLTETSSAKSWLTNCDCVGGGMQLRSCFAVTLSANVEQMSRGPHRRLVGAHFEQQVEPQIASGRLERVVALIVG